MKILVVLLQTTISLTTNQLAEDPGATLKQVRDVVNKGAKPADAMKGMKEEEELDSEEVIEEDEEVTAEAEEVVSEEEATESEEEVVAEEEESEEEVVAEAEEIEEEEEFDVSEDVSALLEGEGFSEEFQEKLAPSLRQHSVPRSKRSRKVWLPLMMRHMKSASQKKLLRLRLL